jgi:hypothetical protein
MSREPGRRQRPGGRIKKLDSRIKAKDINEVKKPAKFLKLRKFG